MKFVRVWVLCAYLHALVLLVVSCGGESGSYSNNTERRDDWRKSSDLASARRSNPTDMVMQVRLRGLGYNPGPIDGIMGPRTRAALQRYQRDQGLLASGLLGPATRARMLPASVRLTAGYPVEGFDRRVSRRTPYGFRYPGDITPLIGVDDGYGLTPAGNTSDNFYRILRPENGHRSKKDDTGH